MQYFLRQTMKKALVLILACLMMAATHLFAQENTESKTIHLTYSDFCKKVWDIQKSPNEFIYKGSLPCVLDFYANWCGPCRKVSPIMETLAKEYDGQLLVYKVNVDDEPELAQSFKVTSIPMVLFFPMEGQPMQQTGALSEQQYKQIIENRLLKK